MQFAYDKAGDVSDQIHKYLNTLHTLIRRIEDQENPTFASTLETLEETYQKRQIFLGCCRMMKSMGISKEGDPEILRKSAEDAIMTSGQFDMRVFLRPALYTKIAALKKTELSPQETLVWKKWKQQCEHYGTHLPEEERAAVWKLLNEHETLATQYQRTINEDKSKIIVKKSEAEGLPEYYLKQNEGKKGWIFISAQHARYALERCTHPRTRERLQEMMGKYAQGVQDRFKQIVQNQQTVAHICGDDDFVAFQQRQTAKDNVKKLLKHTSKATVVPLVTTPTFDIDEVFKVFPDNMEKWTGTTWAPIEIKDWNNDTRTAYSVTGKSPHYTDPVRGICLVEITRTGGQGIRHQALKEGGEPMGALLGIVPTEFEPKHVVDLYREAMKMAIQVLQSNPYHLISGLEAGASYASSVMELQVMHHFGTAVGSEDSKLKKVGAKLREWREGQHVEDMQVAQIDHNLYTCHSYLLDRLAEAESSDFAVLMRRYPSHHRRLDHWAKSVFSNQGGLFYTTPLSYQRAKKFYANHQIENIVPIL